MKVNKEVLEGGYDPKKFENGIYEKWEKSGYFNPDNLPEKENRTEKFNLVVPPPNVTGTLHMGHAAMLAIEDTLVRFERMRGKEVLWQPQIYSMLGSTSSASPASSSPPPSLSQLGIK